MNNHSYVSYSGSGRWERYTRGKLGECPICNSAKSGCDRSPSGLIHCRSTDSDERVPGYRSVKTGLTSIGCSVWAEGDKYQPYTDEEKKEYGERRRRELAEEYRRSAARKLAQGTPSRLDAEYENNYRINHLSPAHRSEFERRGLCDADIERIGAYTAGTSPSGLYLPIRDLSGLRVGAQFKILGEGYRWDRASENRTKAHDELPITFWGNRDNPDRILFVESVGFKPYIASLRFDRDLVIGAAGGQFSTSRLQIIEALAKYPSAKLMLMPDGGAVLNNNIAHQYNALFDLCAELNREIEVAWWDQINKCDGDIDEIDILSTEIKSIPSDWYRSISNRGTVYKDLNKQPKIKNIEERIEQFLSIIPTPRKGSMLFVSSGVGTGKTQQLPPLIASWEKLNPNGRVIVIGYRNALLDQMCERLSITSYRTGYGMEDAAIATSSRLAIVADSLLRLNLADIPANSLVILDEIEAVLSHCAEGSTFGSRAPSIQKHIEQIIDRVLVSGGAVVGLEDAITSLSTKGLGDLTGNKYEIDAIINKYKRFNWDVSIGWKSPVKFSELLIARLMVGERLVLTTTSQKHGEAIEQLVLNRLPELEGKIQRIDSKTINEKRELMTSPVEFLRKVPTQLLILSPSVESGFSIDDGGIEPLFDRVLLYAPSLEVRVHKQMLARYRSNCPRDIYVSKRGAESVGEESIVVNTRLKRYRDNANATALEQGYGRIKNDAAGEVWNRLDSEFKSRKAVSATMLFEFLRHELIEDGHQVVKVDWADVSDRYNRTHKIKIKGDIDGELDLARTQIDDNEARLLFEADGSKMSFVTANMITRSTNTSYALKTVAKKALLHHRLPGSEFSYEFIREAVVADRERYLRDCEMAYLIDKLDLSRAIDRNTFDKQVEQPHLLYSRVPKHAQRARLLNPIYETIGTLLDGHKYLSGDESIATIADYCRKNSYQFWMLFGLNMREVSKGKDDRTYNTDIHLAHKILKKIGYKPSCVGQRGTGKNRVSVYSIVNHDCQHRQLIYEALGRKYATEIDRANSIADSDLRAKQSDFSNKYINKPACLEFPQSPQSLFINGYKQSELEEMAEGLALAAAHPEFLQDLLDNYPIDKLRSAIQLLPDEIKIRFQI